MAVFVPKRSATVGLHSTKCSWPRRPWRLSGGESVACALLREDDVLEEDSEWKQGGSWPAALELELWPTGEGLRWVRACRKATRHLLNSRSRDASSNCATGREEWSLKSRRHTEHSEGPNTCGRDRRNENSFSEPTQLVNEKQHTVASIRALLSMYQMCKLVEIFVFVAAE